MSSFVRFILKFKHSDCARGDVARDIREDGQIKRTWGYRTFKKYLEERGACSRVMDLVEEMNVEYAKRQAGLYTGRV
jgi:hypothetical protein